IVAPHVAPPGRPDVLAARRVLALVGHVNPHLQNITRAQTGGAHHRHHICQRLLELRRHVVRHHAPRLVPANLTCDRHDASCLGAVRVAASRRQAQRVDGSHAHQAITCPPSTFQACPVTPAASPLHRKRTRPATSSALLSRRRGLISANTWAASARLRPVFSAILSAALRTMSVSVQPGQTALTVTPRSATSNASERTSPSTPCLEAQ